MPVFLVRGLETSRVLCEKDPGRAEEKSQAEDIDGSGDEGGSKRRPVSEHGQETGFK